MDSFLVYFICFALGLLFTLLSAIIGHLFGGDSHADIGTGGQAEAGFDHSGLPGLSPFSPTTIASFITAFGGFGLIFSRIEATKSPWISAPLALMGGLLVAGGVLWVFGILFHKTQSSSEGRVSTLIGHAATVITPIPENGVGEIAYVQGGTRYSAPAREVNGSPIPNGRLVRITQIVGSQFYVTPS
jgi:membrane protein implicated in regulation of membrane protease activity